MIQLFADLIRDGFFLLVFLGAIWMMISAFIFEEDREYEPLNRYFDHPSNTSDEPIDK